MSDAVNHPKHYNSHPSGIEAIVICEHMNFCLGNTVKYIFRAGLKEGAGDLEDLKKAQWYLQREIERREKAAAKAHQIGYSIKMPPSTSAVFNKPVPVPSETVPPKQVPSKVPTKRGRPSKLTPRLSAAICASIRAGNSREVAGRRVGISPERLSKWMHRPEYMYRTFRNAVQEAEQEHRLEKVVSKRLARDSKR